MHAFKLFITAVYYIFTQVIMWLFLKNKRSLSMNLYFAHCLLRLKEITRPCLLFQCNKLKSKHFQFAKTRNKLGKLERKIGLQCLNAEICNCVSSLTEYVCIICLTTDSTTALFNLITLETSYVYYSSTP